MRIFVFSYFVNFLCHCYFFNLNWLLCTSRLYRKYCSSSSYSTATSFGSVMAHFVRIRCERRQNIFSHEKRWCAGKCKRRIRGARKKICRQFVNAINHHSHCYPHRPIFFSITYMNVIRFHFDCHQIQHYLNQYDVYLFRLEINRLSKDYDLFHCSFRYGVTWDFLFKWPPQQFVMGFTLIFKINIKRR